MASSCSVLTQVWETRRRWMASSTPKEPGIVSQELLPPPHVPMESRTCHSCLPMLPSSTNQLEVGTRAKFLQWTSCFVMLSISIKTCQDGLFHRLVLNRYTLPQRVNYHPPIIRFGVHVHHRIACRKMDCFLTWKRYIDMFQHMPMVKFRRTCYYLLAPCSPN